MKVDKILVGSKCVLVGYRPHHVEKYHTWMLREELLEQTASEPLSLEKEYEMQKSWEVDQDKLTFIVLDAKDNNVADSGPSTVAHMLGDVNLFFNDSERPKCAEIEVMIGKKLISVSAKIGYANEASLSLFRKLKFVEVSRCDVFKEVTLELEINQDAKERLFDPLEGVVSVIVDPLVG